MERCTGIEYGFRVGYSHWYEAWQSTDLYCDCTLEHHSFTADAVLSTLWSVRILQCINNPNDMINTHASIHYNNGACWLVSCFHTCVLTLQSCNQCNSSFIFASEQDASTHMCVSTYYVIMQCTWVSGSKPT